MSRKFRQVKNRRLVIEGTVFVYSIIGYDQVVKIRFYHQRKTPFLEIAFDYPSVWAIDPYRPKVLAELLLIHQSLQRPIDAGLTVVTTAESARWVPRLGALAPPLSLG